MRPKLRGFLAGALVLVLAGCGGGAVTRSSPTDSRTGQPADPSAVPAGPDESLRPAALEVIAARERALVEGDRAGFLATVDPAEEAFVATQARWFDNLADLPVTGVSIRPADVGDLTWVRAEGDLQLAVDVTMQLDGFDPEPVVHRQIYTFQRTEGGVRLADDRNAEMDARTGWRPAPWDLTRIAARRDGPVLGIFDAETVSRADTVMAELAGARDRVRDLVPSWSGRVVAYVVGDPEALDTMIEEEDVDTGGVAFPVPASPDSDRVATYRLMVNPDAGGLESAGATGYLFRHELVHVALAARDDASPLWLVEGIAEHVAASSLPPRARRQYTRDTLAGAPPRLLRLEPGRSFYRRGPDVHYALAALVCDHLVATRGPGALLDLVDAFDRAGASSAANVERVLRRELGLGSAALARGALDRAGLAPDQGG